MKNLKNTLLIIIGILMMSMRVFAEYENRYNVQFSGANVEEYQDEVMDKPIIATISRYTTADNKHGFVLAKFKSREDAKIISTKSGDYFVANGYIVKKHDISFGVERAIYEHKTQKRVVISRRDGTTVMEANISVHSSTKQSLKDFSKYLDLNDIGTYWIRSEIEIQEKLWR